MSTWPLAVFQNTTEVVSHPCPNKRAGTDLVPTAVTNHVVDMFVVSRLITTQMLEGASLDRSWALESGKIPLLLSYCGLVSKLRLGYKVVYVPSCTHPPPPLPLIVESFNEEIDTICVVDLAYYDIERMILMQLMQVV